MSLKKLKHEDLLCKHVELHGGTKAAAEEEISKVFSTVESLMSEGVEEGIRVPIKNFGIFTAKMSKERTQNNHLAKKVITIASAPTISFKKSKSLKV